MGKSGLVVPLPRTARSRPLSARQWPVAHAPAPHSPPPPPPPLLLRDAGVECQPLPQRHKAAEQQGQNKNLFSDRGWSRPSGGWNSKKGGKHPPFWWLPSQCNGSTGAVTGCGGEWPQAHNPVPLGRARGTDEAERGPEHPSRGHSSTSKTRIIKEIRHRDTCPFTKRT